MEHNRKSQKWDNTIKYLSLLAICILFFFSWLVYYTTLNVTSALLSAAGMSLLCIICFLIHYFDSRYITAVISDLSRLTDLLTELEEQPVFPENEDTLCSKLQSKIIKLINILKKRQKTSLLEQNNIKALVSDISHQLKTPIANLMMYSEFLEEPSLSKEKQSEYIHTIRLCVERLNFLSESMIKLSRLESGLIHLNQAEQSLNETVLKAVKDIFTKAKEKQCEIIYHEENNIIIPHDRNWTAEAVFNLLDNAVKYSRPHAKIHLTVKTFGMFAAVEVADENSPIPKEEQNKIFSRFYRGSNSHTTEGIGVGLYLAREIAMKSGGYMNLRTTKQGNIFSLTLYSKASIPTSNLQSICIKMDE